MIIIERFYSSAFQSSPIGFNISFFIITESFKYSYIDFAGCLFIGISFATGLPCLVMVTSSWYVLTLSIIFKHLALNFVADISIYKTEAKRFRLNSRWISGECNIITYNLNELLGTKIRALYQRKKGRDLFDIWYILKNRDIDIEKTIIAYHQYMDFVNCDVSKKQYQNNIKEKIRDSAFRNDINGLIQPNMKYNIDKAWKEVNNKLIEKL